MTADPDEPDAGVTEGTGVRAEIIFTADEDAPRHLDWLAGVRPQFSFISEDEGCGCCVHIFRVEGPADAIRAIPAELCAFSPWSQPRLYARQADLHGDNAQADALLAAAGAFRQRRYVAVAELLAPYEADLSEVWRRKLVYSRAHSRRGSTALARWWHRFRRRLRRG